jgi:hypothetical protein
MWTAAALWDVLAKAANLAQMSVILVAVFTSLLRAQRSNKRECAELDRCSRRLRELLQWPTGCGVALLCSEMGGPVVEALGDAARLVDAYHGSSIWRRLWSAGETAAQLSDMHDVVNSYCSLLLSVNAHLLLHQAIRHHPVISPSSDDST